MPLRIVIWVLAGALTGTAAAAILALLMPGAEIAWRFTGTGGLLAAGCLALLPAVRSWESGRPSFFSCVAMVVIGLAMAIGLSAIWWETLLGRTGFDADRLWVSDLLVVAWLLVAWLPLRLVPHPWWRRPASISLGFLSAAFLLFGAEVLDIWSGDEARRGWVLLGFAPVMGTLALPFPVGRRTIWRWARWLGIATAIAAIGMLMVVLPFSGGLNSLSERTETIATALSSIAVTVAVGVALELAKGPPWRVWIHRITVAIVATEGVLVTISMGQSDDVTVILPLALIAVVGLVTAILLDATERMAERRGRAVATLSEVRLSCPRCGKSQTMALDRVARCDGCGLGIEVRVRQEECLRCGYSRIGLPEGAACPECGAPGAAGRGSEASLA